MYSAAKTFYRAGKRKITVQQKGFTEQNVLFEIFYVKTEKPGILLALAKPEIIHVIWNTDYSAAEEKKLFYSAAEK